MLRILAFFSRNGRYESGAAVPAASTDRPVFPGSGPIAAPPRIGGWGHLRTLCTATKFSYSITSSAMASSVGGTVRPSALAVLRLIVSWYFVGC
jgi:hypothetical protein